MLDDTDRAQFSALIDGTEKIIKNFSRFGDFSKKPC